MGCTGSGMARLSPLGHMPSPRPVFVANLSKKSRAAALGEQPVYQGPVHCIATIVRTEGLAGLYRGASAMLLRDIPGYCLYFIPYVFLSEWITPEACAGPSPCAVWLAGGMAGKSGSGWSPVPGPATEVQQGTVAEPTMTF